MFEDSTHGGRQRNRAGCVGTHHFNSRPHGGRLSTVKRSDTTGIFQLTPSRRATGCRSDKRTGTAAISTHALTEGDSVAFLPFSISPVNFLGIIFLCPSFHVFSSMLPSIPSAPDLPSDLFSDPAGQALVLLTRESPRRTEQFR